MGYSLFISGDYSQLIIVVTTLLTAILSFTVFNK